MSGDLIQSLASVQFTRALDPGVDNGRDSPSPWPCFQRDRPWYLLAYYSLAHPKADDQRNSKLHRIVSSLREPISNQAFPLG